MMHCQNRAFGDCRLHGISCDRDVVDVWKGVEERSGVAHGGWCVLTFGAGIETKTTRLRARAKAVYGVKPALIGSAVVIRDRLSEVVAVAHRQAGDALETGIGTLVRKHGSVQRRRSVDIDFRGIAPAAPPISPLSADRRGCRPPQFRRAWC
jgi:hypothetical protein